MKDPANTHQYSYNNVIAAIRERMSRENVRIDYEKGFNTFVLNLVIDFYNVKAEPLYAYKQPDYSEDVEITKETDRLRN